MPELSDLSDADRAELRDRLSAARERAAVRIARLTREYDAVVESAALDAPDDEHDPEGATIGFERAQLAALIERARTDLADLDRALVGLSDPTFGICERCRAPIGIERLLARPGASLCVACAARR